MENDILQSLKINSSTSGSYSDRWIEEKTTELSSYSPLDNSKIGSLFCTSDTSYEKVITTSIQTFNRWRILPAPRRGEIVRQIGNAFREHKEQLAKLITLESGKIIEESRGEVQELIDIADFAVGLSRQLYGLSMHSERPGHRMTEQWQPLGPIGVITAFNFPLAVWGWNAMLAAVCGDTVIWKPSELTPFVAVAAMKICEEVTSQHNFQGLFSLIIGDGAGLGSKLAADTRLPLISATGSTAMGRSVGEVVAKRLGRSLLELGGNNAVILLKDADLELATKAIFFGAVGTAGQRCTTTRRLIVDNEITQTIIDWLLPLYKNVKIGDPFQSDTLMGPLINERAVKNFEMAIKEIKNQGGEIITGGEICSGLKSNNFVQPTIIKATRQMKIVKEETFAPILYILPVDSLEEAVAVNNEVPQGLSSSIFTNSIRAAEYFLSQAGSDCGIANVNIGTSGAEIGGAFGGEKDTGGGREAGSDAWKNYMRRQTITTNWSHELPLAQGIKFETN
jgi:aldehyde dehydrogenase (NAD+)